MTLPTSNIVHLFALFLVGFTNAFQQHPFLPSMTIGASSVASKKSHADGDSPSRNNHNNNPLPVGTFVEFEEKKRLHAGRIEQTEHKSNGGARYVVADAGGHHYNIPDRAVQFAMHPPNTPGAAGRLFEDFCAAQRASEQDLQAALDVTPEILQLAWEEAAADASDDVGGDESSTASSGGLMTPSLLVELVHSHGASAIEKYMAWRLLQSDLAHVFFKEIKDHGRVVAFKSKARKTVEAAKQAFCISHQDSDLCLI